MTATRPGEQEIRDWLTRRIASALEVPAGEIDIASEFPSFGVDSVTAVAVTGDLEQWLGRTLDPTLLFTYSTIDSLARHLSTAEES